MSGLHSELPGSVHPRAAAIREPSVGDHLDGRYELKRKIACGGGGAVFEAVHLVTRRHVAIKILHARYAGDQEQRKRMLLEARALTIARQPNVVEVLDAGIQDGSGLPYVVMELLEGRTLAGLLASRRRLEIGAVVHVGRQLAIALSHIHSRGLVHRDVKPSNVLIARSATGQELLKLFDFGIARAERGNEGERLTGCNVLMGTPEYMSPEQLLGSDELDHRCDIYAVGVTLYECLTGSVPFEGSFGEILLKAATSDLPPMSVCRPEIPADLIAIVEQALARDPNARLQSAQDLYDALTALAVQRFPTAAALGVAGTSTMPTDSSESLLNATAGVEQRRFSRAPYVTPVRIVQDGGRVLDARIEDISESGALVVLSEAIERDANVQVRFALPVSGRIVTTRATVRWSRAARLGVAVGLEFDLNEEERATIRYYVSTVVREALTPSEPTPTEIAVSSREKTVPAETLCELEVTNMGSSNGELCSSRRQP